MTDSPNEPASDGPALDEPAPGGPAPDATPGCDPSDRAAAAVPRGGDVSGPAVTAAPPGDGPSAPESDELPSYDPSDPAFRADPYPVYRRLRDAGPLARGFLGTPAFVRFRDCERLLHDPRLGKDFAKSSLYEAVLRQTGGNPPPFLGFGIEGGSTPFMLVDPPEHTRLRGLVARAFTEVLTRHAAPAARTAVAEQLDALGEEFDAVSDLAVPLPVRVLADLLGIPEADRAYFAALGADISGVLELDVTLSEEAAGARRRAIADCMGYFRDLTADRRAHPGPDLVTALLAAGDGTDRLTDLDVATTALLMTAAGLDTTATLVASCVWVLARHPEAYARLVAEPSLAPGAVTEVLRFEPPAPEMGRIALEDFTYQGHRFRKGEALLLVLGSANRDERRFADGDRFVIDRGDTGHLAFGSHIHRCLGAPLAELTAAHVLQGLAARFGTLGLAVGAPPIKDGFVLRGPRVLPVTTTRHARPAAPAQEAVRTR